MKIKNLHILSAKFTGSFIRQFAVAALCIVSLAYPAKGKSQFAYWLESLNQNVKAQNIAFAPVNANKATTLTQSPVPLYIFVDERNGFVYWSDAGTGTIRRISTSGGPVYTVVSGIYGTGVYPRGIYMDVTHNVMYWAETAPGLADVIKKVSLSGELPKLSSSGTVVVSAIDIVRGITVDTVANQVYFADAGISGSRGIYRASTTAAVTEAGASKIAALTASQQPNALALDRAKNFIYWSDFALNGKIQRAATNAASYPVTATTLFTGASVRGISIDPSINTIYWTEYPSLKIKKASLANIPLTGPTDVVTALSILPRNVYVTSSLTPPPAILSFTPLAGGKGNVITIKGLHFMGATGVSFGGVHAKSFTVLSDTSISAVPGTGQSGAVGVQNQYGADSLAGFTYCATLTKLKVNVSVSPDTVICSGSVATLTARLVDGGDAAYQWYKNNVAVGGNGNRYKDNTLANGDSVWCVVTADRYCTVSNMAKSNVVKFTITPKAPVSVRVTVSPGTTVCTGSPATFTANTTNAGENPIYTWKKNGKATGNNSPYYTDTVPQSGDSVVCILKSSQACVVNSTVMSQPVTIAVVSIPPPDQPSVIKGPVTVTPNQQNLNYQVTKVAATNYNWIVPEGVTIESGQGGFKVVVDWNSTDGYIAVSAVNACGVSEQRSLAVHVMAGLSALETNSDNSVAGKATNLLRYYPNPVSNTLTVEFAATAPNKYEAQVVNSMGQVVTSKAGVAVQGLNQVSFNMSSVATAVYYVRLVDEEHGTRTLKVVKVK